MGQLKRTQMTNSPIKVWTKLTVFTPVFFARGLLYMWAEKLERAIVRKRQEQKSTLDSVSAVDGPCWLDIYSQRSARNRLTRPSLNKVHCAGRS